MEQAMQECFRWYGANDPVPLDHIRQAGATGVVTALHHIYDGSAWPESEILAHKRAIEAAGLSWSVVESIPVHNSIKIGAPGRDRFIEQYKQTIRALAAAGIRTVCYNFMPVVDWTRTDLMYPMASTGFALRFDAVDFAAYDIFILARENAADDYAAFRVEEAEARFKAMDEDTQLRVERNLIAGLPATERVYDRPAFRAALAEYRDIDAAALRANLFHFLSQIIPVAAECGVNMCIHPDDPPFSLFGLPRVVSTADDARAILAAVDLPQNGLTFCTGSYGARPDNDLPAMVEEFADRIHFAHLRNVTLEADGSFHEADHLDGSTDMEAVVIALTREELRREQQGRPDARIPMRPDHGHLLADDIGKARINPGYSLIGRLKGLAEIRGAMRMARRFL